MTAGRDFGRPVRGDFGKAEKAEPAPEPAFDTAGWLLECRRRLRPELAPTDAGPAVAPPADLPLGARLAYWNLRDALAGELLRGNMKPSAAAIVDRLAAAGMTRAAAAEFAERFLASLVRDLARRRARRGS